MSLSRIQRAYYLGQALGWENLPRRVWQVARGRLVQRRLLPGGEAPAEQMRKNFVADYEPAQATERWRRRARLFFVNPQAAGQLRPALREQVDDARWAERTERIVDELRRGRMLFFSDWYAETGWPPQFNVDPVEHIAWPTGRHWSTYRQFDSALSDIKLVWEASRFSWAYHLARQHVRHPESDAAELFWTGFDAWNAQNPYGLTPQWACGQEATFRLMAWLFAACAMLEHAASTPARLHRLTELAWYTGRHIAGNINYARSQKNNHAISEAIGLWTIGLLFPELRAAPRWRARGRRVLMAELSRQIAPDGSYVQHSLNYHRVMLDDLLWALALGRSAGEDQTETLRPKLSPALKWLLEMIEPDNGACPNYGNNDGALVLPLDTCAFTDYRPVAQATHYALHGSRCFEPGPWDEKALWLFGPAALAAPVRRHERRAAWVARDRGYFTMKGPRSWAMTRCHTYRDRPFQNDMLHLDLWYGPTNLLRDGGTYRYFTDEPWDSYFKSTAGHNTVQVAGQDQMIRGPRFLWFRWVRARLIRFATSNDGRVCYFEGEHDGYTRLPGNVVHRRAICRIDDAYVILDDVLGADTHEIALRWRLCPADWRMQHELCTADIGAGRAAVQVAPPPDFETVLLNGQETPEPEGWEALVYGQKQPAPCLRVRGMAALPIRIATLVQCDSGGPSATLLDSGAGDAVRLGGLDPQLDPALREASGGRLRVAATEPAVR